MITFSTILDRIGSKLIGLKFVGSSISPDLWIYIIIECFHGLGNAFVAIDVLIIIVQSLQCMELWPVDFLWYVED